MKTIHCEDLCYTNVYCTHVDYTVHMQTIHLTHVDYTIINVLLKEASLSVTLSG